MYLDGNLPEVVVGKVSPCVVTAVVTGDAAKHNGSKFASTNVKSMAH